MPLITVLAQTVAKPPPTGIWYPTIIGILVVAAAIALFCGSIYVLLATNLGARLGFLAAFTGLMGFMVLLTVLWMSTTSPLNTLRGTIPAWKVQQVVSTLHDKSVPANLRDAPRTGRVVPTTAAAVIKAAVDARLVTTAPVAAFALPADINKFARFTTVTDFKEVKYYEIGGSTPHLVDWQLNHKPLYAVVQFCGVLPNTLPFGVPPPTPTCDPSSTKSGFAILRFEYGSLRIPPFVAFLASSILFGLGLLSLHWREKDERAAKAAAEKLAAVTPQQEERPLVGAPQ
jgi:hypothetical protein